jgi:hypothetical protein
MDSSGIYLEKNVQSSLLETLENFRKIFGPTLDKTMERLSIIFREKLQLLKHRLQESYIDAFRRMIKEFPKDHFVCAMVMRKIPEDDTDTLHYFIREVLHLHPDYATDIWFILRKIDWLSEEGRQIKKPYSYIKTSAQRSFSRFRILSEIFPLEEETNEFVDESQTEIGYIEEILSLKQACVKANLKPETTSEIIKLLVARSRYGVTRDEAPEFLGWTEKKSESVWRYFNLKKPALKKHLLS